MSTWKAIIFSFCAIWRGPSNLSSYDLSSSLVLQQTISHYPRVSAICISGHLSFQMNYFKFCPFGGFPFPAVLQGTPWVGLQFYSSSFWFLSNTMKNQLHIKPKFFLSWDHTCGLKGGVNVEQESVTGIWALVHEITRTFTNCLSPSSTGWWNGYHFYLMEYCWAHPALKTGRLGNIQFLMDILSDKIS